MPTLFVYHKDCFDGFTAAWVYSRNVDRGAEFFPAKYGDAPPDVRGRNVIIADFSYPRDVMFKIACEADSLTVLDHHVTAQQALEGLERQVLLETGRVVRIVFDMERSGAGLVWDELAVPRGGTCEVCGAGSGHFEGCSFSKRQRLVSYVEDRDLWRQSLLDTHEHAALVSATPMTFEDWDRLCGWTRAEFTAQGRAILEYMRQYGTKALAEARLLEWPKLWREHWTSAPSDDPRTFAWCVNLPYMNCSEYITRLLEERGGNFAAGYFRRGDGRWQFSLRSKADFDVSEIAKMYGGGGHKQAAGFDVADLAEVFGNA